MRAAPEHETDAFHESIVDNLSDGVYYVDRRRTITYWNRGAERISGYGPAEVTGHRYFEEVLRHVDERGRRLCHGPYPLVRTMATGRPQESRIYIHHKDGHRAPVYVRTAAIRDPSSARSRSSTTTAHGRRPCGAGRAASPVHDRPRHRAAQSAGARALPARTCAGRGRAPWPLGVLFADIDRFKDVNDTFGHELGDRVLAMVGNTLRSALRSNDVVGRWGGEEFVAFVAVTLDVSSSG